MERTPAAGPAIAALQSSVAKLAARRKSSRRLKYVLLVVSVIQAASVPAMLLLPEPETAIPGHAAPTDSTAGSTPRQAGLTSAVGGTGSDLDPVAALLRLVPLLVLAGTASGSALAWRVERRAAREHRLARERLERELARRHPLPEAR